MARALSGIEVSIDNLQDSNALVLYKVGPVLVCSPAMPVESITIPPNLNSLPGANDAEPGVFKSMHGMVRVVDLRVRFGVDDVDKKNPGRIIISEVTGGYAGFWVDEIEDVISFPGKGWSQLPAHVPREVFSRALIRDEGIRLYADLENLDKFKATGYLRSHIEIIKSDGLKHEKQDNNERSKDSAGKTKRINKAVSDVSPKIVSEEINSKKLHKSFDSPVNKVEIKNSSSKNDSALSERTVSDGSEKKLINKKVLPINLPKAEIKKPESMSRASVAQSKKVEKNTVYNKLSAVDVVTGRAAKKDLIIDSDIFSEHIKNNVEIAEESNNTIMWVSIILVGAFVLSVYMVEFTGLLDDDYSAVEIRKKLQVNDNKLNILNKNTDDSAEDVEFKEIAIYENNKVDVSKTDEGIFIVINDYEKEEENKSIESDFLDGSGDNLKEAAAGDVEENKTGSQGHGFRQRDSDVLVEGLSKSKLSMDPSIVFQGENNEIVNVVNEMVSNASFSKQEQLVENKAIKTRKNIHIVVEGDTLWDIAKRYVNDPWKYPELARLSEIKDPDLIYPGQKVVIIYNTNK